MKTASDICRELGMRLNSYADGAHYAPCPRCSPMRKAVNKRKKCLTVTIDNVGVKWCCHHCGDQGGRFYDQGGLDARAGGIRSARIGPRGGGPLGVQVREREVCVRLCEHGRSIVPEVQNPRQAMVDHSSGRKTAFVEHRQSPRAWVQANPAPRHHGR